MCPSPPVSLLGLPSSQEGGTCLDPATGYCSLELGLYVGP